MKQVRGKPWSDEIKDKTLAENLDIFENVNNADRGIMHRDLKPENIMTGGYGEVMVMDWGLAAAFREGAKAEKLKKKTAVCGTPAYMAPEMSVGNGQLIGKASDIYLLGAILFEIIVGAPPHTGKTVIECLKNSANSVFRETDVKGELMDIAMKAMAPKPEDRYASVNEFQEAIKKYESHTESISLAKRAGKDLEKAEETGVYEDYSKSVFGFQEAINLWAENKNAAEGLSKARLAYATCALSKDDLELAENQLVEDTPEFNELKEKVTAARKERDKREHNLKVAKKAGIVLVSIIIIGGIGAGIWIYSEREKAIAEGIKAKESAKIAEENLSKMRRIQAKEAKLRLQIHGVDTLEEAIAQRKDASETENLPLTREIDLGGNIKIPLSFIPAGIYTMGSNPTEKDREATESLHDVRITKPFYMAAYETTQEQWRKILPGKQPSTFKGKDVSPRHPVESVSYNDIINKFLPAIQKFAPEGYMFDLPTEAEWEYACRTNTKGAYSFGNNPGNLGKNGWYIKNSDGKSHYTGGKEPNAWGLYDMHGNVAEWCKDNFIADYYLDSPENDPICTKKSPHKVVRGGGWPFQPKQCRTAYRTAAKPTQKQPFIGFRLVMKKVTKEK
jgi:formylglycine-generating enzyme required for sulfatase activity